MKRAGYVVALGLPGAAEPDLAEQIRYRDGWKVVSDESQAIVAAPHALEVKRVGRAIVLGPTFERGDPGVADEPTLAAADFTQRFWGAYVAVLPETTGIVVMRDPSGRMPCFSTCWRGWRVFVGDLEDLIALGWRPSGIAWSVLGELLQEPRMHDGRTALNGVRELLPGQSMGQSGQLNLAWSPGAFTHDDMAVDDARKCVRETVLSCVGAWAGRYGKILHLLSGGLDSSIVLACLAECGLADRVRCLNFTGGDRSELDEGRYAREAADRAGVELVQRQFKPRHVDLSRARAMTNTPRPSGYAYSIENDDFELEAAQAWRADACFSAAGGDGLFYQLRAKIYCADYLQLRGPRPGLMRVAYDSALLTRSSVWSTLALGFKFRDGLFDPAAAPRNSYLADGVGRQADGWFHRHPWAQSAQALPPGKKLHLWALLDALNFTYNYRRAEIAETVLPLVSQPIIETMLRIPSFVLARGGTDRTLVREAFADMAPASVIARSGKGAMDGYYAELCCANAPFIRDRLLGGVLASKGMLNTERIAKALPAQAEPADGAEADLLKLFAAEIWAAGW